MNKKWLGNTLIIIPLVCIGLLVGPILKIYLFPSQIKDLSHIHTFTVTVPKIRAQANIIPQVNPWKEVIYNEALKHGVAQAKGSVYPGEKGTIYLFAHSSQAPWEITSNNIPFLRLGELTTGDSIYINWNNKIYKYNVKYKKEIWPNDIQYLTNLHPTQLILQTCSPIGTSLKRLLIFAQLVQVTSI